MPRLVIEKDRVASYAWRPTPNISRTIRPEGVVIHYTGSQSAPGALEHLTNPKTEVSAHFLIDAAGRGYQLAPCTVKAWHAGESSFEGRPGVNEYAIGIELVNPGPLVKRVEGYFDYNGAPWHGSVITAKHKRAGIAHRYWAGYPPTQLGSALDLVAALVMHYRLRFVIGHDDITDRKIDPGPAFPLKTFQTLVPLLAGSTANGGSSAGGT